LPIGGHLWRRVGGSVTVGDATARFSGRKSVFTHYLFHPLSVEQDVMFVRTFVFALFLTRCVIAAEPDRILMLPERADNPVVLAAETQYGTVLVRYHSPIVYLLQDEKYTVLNFIEGIAIENNNVISRASNGFCVVDGKPIAVTIDGDAGLDLQNLNPDLIGHYTFDGAFAGVIHIGLNIGESRLQVPVELIRVPFKKGSTATELVDKYGLPTSQQPFYVEWPISKRIDQILYTPTVRETVFSGEHWTFKDLPGAIFSIQNGAIARIGSWMPFKEKIEDEKQPLNQAEMKNQPDQSKIALAKLIERKKALEEELIASKKGPIDLRLDSDRKVTRYRDERKITWKSIGAKKTAIKDLEAEIAGVEAEIRRVDSVPPVDTPTNRGGEVAFREWSDTTGQFKLNAILVKVDGASVVLQKKDGQEISVSLEKLSEADIKYIREAK